MAVEDIQKKKLTEDELNEGAGGGEGGPGDLPKINIDDDESQIDNRYGSARKPLEHTVYLNRKFV